MVVHRRHILSSAGTIGVAGLAGCAYIPWACASSVTLDLRPASSGTSSSGTDGDGAVTAIDEEDLTEEQIAILEDAIDDRYEECSEDGVSDQFSALLTVLPTDDVTVGPDGDLTIEFRVASGQLRFRSTVYSFSVTESTK